jgi:hypothetical protein
MNNIILNNMAIRVLLVLVMIMNLFSVFADSSVSTSSNMILENNPKTVLSLIKNNYEGLQSLRIEMKYKLYRDYESDEVYQEYSSEYCRNEAGSYRRIGDTEMISNEDYSLKVNHSEKAIFVTNTQEISAFDTDLEASLKFCSDVKFLEEDGTRKIVMIIKRGTDLPYSMIQLEVDKKYWIKRIKLFYSIQIDFSDSYFEKELGYPRLEVDYEIFKDKWKDKENILQTEKYVLQEPEGFKPSETLSNYKIVDYLIQN